jgi:hypothetical protein
MTWKKESKAEERSRVHDGGAGPASIPSQPKNTIIKVFSSYNTGLKEQNEEKAAEISIEATNTTEL